MSAPAVETRDLVREFKGGIRAVDGVSLVVDSGGIFGFLGPNGAGKSTTVRMLTTLLRPTGGTAVVAGYDVMADPGAVRRRIGVALQDAAIDPYMTGRELLRLQGVLHGLPRAECRARAEDLLARVGLEDAADRRVGTYSGGMRRRLDLALSLVHEPVVLFLDEPTTGLDPTSRVALWEEVRRLNTEHGTTIFLTTQYLEEADQLADRVAIIDGGRIVADGAPAALKADIGEPLLTVTAGEGSTPEDIGRVLARFGPIIPGSVEHGAGVRLPGGSSAMADAVRALDDAGVRFQSIDLAEPTLDDVFLKCTGRHLEGAGDEAPRRVTAAAPALRQTAALAWRSIITTIRLPQAWFPALFFPLVLMAIFTASFGGAPGAVPGFPPVRGFLDFAVCGAIVQGVLIGGTSAGAAFATDIEGGFFDRLVASPTSRVAILTGRLGASMALGLFQAVLFIGIAWIFGARVDGGITGFLIVLLIAVIFAAAVGGLGVYLALRTGSGEAVQGMFPLFFALLFFSSAFFPIETMTGWYAAVARVNPISWLVESMRLEIIGGATVGTTLAGIGTALGLAVITIGASALALRRRLRVAA